MRLTMPLAPSSNEPATGVRYAGGRDCRRDYVHVSEFGCSIPAGGQLLFGAHFSHRRKSGPAVRGHALQVKEAIQVAG